VIAFIAVLLTTRLDEIAHFVTLGPEGIYIFLFTIYQIPYILPIALPIAGLISAILLIQRLSRTHELTALRAAGIGLGGILAPILLAAAFLALVNFYVISELSTQSHLATGLIKNELRSVNPLLLLHNKHLMKMKGIFFNTLGPSKMGESAYGAIVATPSKNNDRINVLVADSLKASPTAFAGHHVAFFSTLSDDALDKADNLLLENMGNASTTLEDFGQMMQKKVWTLNNDHLKMPLLLSRLADEKKALGNAKRNGDSVSSQKQIQRSINRIYTEIIRRISVAIAVFTFTLMGAAFGFSISRRQSSRGLFIVICLASLYLIAFFVAKGMDHLFEASLALYTVPHLLIVVLSIAMIERIGKGIE
jgi:lipopolysaccharide export system permease protein